MYSLNKQYKISWTYELFTRQSLFKNVNVNHWYNDDYFLRSVNRTILKASLELGTLSLWYRILFETGVLVFGRFIVIIEC